MAETLHSLVKVSAKSCIWNGKNPIHSDDLGLTGYKVLMRGLWVWVDLKVNVEQ